MRIQIHYRNNHKTETFFSTIDFIDYLNKSRIARSKISKYTYDWHGHETAPVTIPMPRDGQ